MGLRMRNCNIWGSIEKSDFLGGGHEKPIYWGDCLKRGAWKVGRFKMRLSEKEVAVFLRRGVIPQCTL